jgi:hypothetical protein
MESDKKIRIFIFVIGSFENPYYEQMLKMRKEYLEKYGIPYLILLDGDIPKSYKLGEKDRWYEKDKEFDPKRMNPHMIQKFLKGLKEINEKEYDYIIRVNISTFMNIPLLLSILEKEKRTKYAGGSLLLQKYNLDINNPVVQRFPLYLKNVFEMISGTCMIFSNDVIEYLKTLPLFLPFYEHSYDDVILSFLVKEYTDSFVNIPMTFHVGNRVIRCKEGFPLYRIRHTDRSYDILVWKELIRIYEANF